VMKLRRAIMLPWLFAALIVCSFMDEQSICIIHSWMNNPFAIIHSWMNNPFA
jgi:hypothetical protein